MLFLFTKHDKLSRYLTPTYVDFENEVVMCKKLKSASKSWSSSERFMLDLALHLFNSVNKVDLSEMDYLDASNSQLALKAIEMRYA